MDISNFIKEHNEKYTCYCEILILKDGTPVYANPSHQLKLAEVYGVPRERMYLTHEWQELQNTIPENADPTEWLIEKTQSVAVWYNLFIFPLVYTKEQIETARKLIEAGCVSKQYRFDVAYEYSACKLLSEKAEEEQFYDLRDKVYDVLASIEEKLKVVNTDDEE